jgi:hypothetical protein
MPSSLRRPEERRTIFLTLFRTLAEADASMSSGNRREIQAAIDQVGSAFDLYSSRLHQDERVEEDPFDAFEETRRAILRTLSTLLMSMDRSLSRGDLDMVGAALRQAQEAVRVVAGLDHERSPSGIRSRFPRRPGA